jgi:hypothetical protein
MIVIKQVVFEQNLSWAAAFATPPAESGEMSVVVPSEPRLTW